MLRDNLLPQSIMITSEWIVRERKPHIRHNTSDQLKMHILTNLKLSGLKDGKIWKLSGLKDGNYAG